MSLALIAYYLFANKTLGLFLILNTFAILVTWVFVVFREMSHNKMIVLLMNIQWPLSLLTYLIFGQALRDKMLLIGFLPLIIYILVGVINIISVFLTRNFLAFKETFTPTVKSIDEQSLAKRVLRFTLLAFPFSIILSSDRFIYPLLLGTGTLDLYAFLITIFTGAFSIILLLNSLSISKMLKSDYFRMLGLKLKKLGIFVSICFFLGVGVLQKFF